MFPRSAFEHEEKEGSRKLFKSLRNVNEKLFNPLQFCPNNDFRNFQAHLTATLPHFSWGWVGQWGKVKKGLSFVMYEVNDHIQLMTGYENN